LRHEREQRGGDPYDEGSAGKPPRQRQIAACRERREHAREHAGDFRTLRKRVLGPEQSHTGLCAA
jgi:hypothetical protein